MDDKQFDDHLKARLGEFEDPHFDPSALAALHRQMTVVSSWPWYVQYRTELLVGSSLAFCTLVILWSLWFMSSNTNHLVNEKIRLLQAQESEMVRLRKEISELKDARDTVRIVEMHERQTAGYAALLQRIAFLEAAAIRGTTADPKSNSFTSGVRYDSQFVWTANAFSDTSLDAKSFSDRRAEIRQRKGSNEVTTAERSPSSQAKLSVKALRDLEEHYQKGIGVRVGPVVEASRGFYHPGSGRLDLGVGAQADFVLSPSLSLETGGKFFHRFYELSDANKLSNEDWPGLDESLGVLKLADVDSWVLEIPVNLKYWYPVSPRRHWLAGVGYSAVLYTTQVLEYEYGMESNPSATVNSTYRDTKATLYPGTLNFSLGLASRLKNKKLLETSLYYQIGTGDMGLENSKPNFLGVRGVYWFTVR